MTKSLSRHPKSSKTPCCGHSWPSWSSWWWPKVLYTLPKYSQCLKDSKKVSYVGVQCQNTHQDSQNPPKPHVLDILDLPDLPYGDHMSCTPFQSNHNVPRIPKSYHMWGHNDKKLILVSICCQMNILMEKKEKKEESCFIGLMHIL